MQGQEEPDQYSIAGIIKDKAVTTYFQPIISLKDKTAVGVEALSRGIHPSSSKLIPPLDLIDRAKQHGLGLELDRLFREKALDTYQKINPAAEVLLFINVNPKILDSDDLELGWTDRKVSSLGLRSDQIAIEICESSITDTDKLIKFAASYRRQGFLIAMDDYGINHSNLERIVQIRPDIVKIPRELIDGVHADFYKEAIVKSIVQLTKNIGAITVAEGFELEQDVIKCHELGIDLYQGFYFAQPSQCCVEHYQQCRETIHKTLFKLSGHMKQHTHEKRELHLGFIKTCKALLKKLKDSPATAFPALLNSSEVDQTNIDCLYLLNAAGRLTHKISLAETNRPYHQYHLFQHLGENSDHSAKDYFVLSFHNEADIFISDEFVSYTSNNYCKTISAKFIDKEGNQHTFCIDFILNKAGNDRQLRATAN